MECGLEEHIRSFKHLKEGVMGLEEALRKGLMMGCQYGLIQRDQKSGGFLEHSQQSCYGWKLDLNQWQGQENRGTAAYEAHKTS
jgi:hypothetical protein